MLPFHGRSGGMQPISDTGAPASNSSAKKETTFLDLPLELRNEIYDLIVCHTTARASSNAMSRSTLPLRHPACVYPALAKVSHQVRAEVLPLWIGAHRLAPYLVLADKSPRPSLPSRHVERVVQSITANAFCSLDLISLTVHMGGKNGEVKFFFCMKTSKAWADACQAPHDPEWTWVRMAGERHSLFVGASVYPEMPMVSVFQTEAPTKEESDMELPTNEVLQTLSEKLDTFLHVAGKDYLTRSEFKELVDFIAGESKRCWT